MSYCFNLTYRSVSPKQPDRRLEATGPAVRTDRTAADITITELYDLSEFLGGFSFVV